ncbi:STAS domain-containing protein [Streptomyces sp. NPDC001276]|uniref:STAS domain-containing protein n=1 Tax=Streptomyces sp. NPDC001276 TaxID=3364555 RepID=UPI0036B02EB3
MRSRRTARRSIYSDGTGEVDVYTSPVIHKAVTKLLDEGHRHFVLDLCAVPLLDSRGLGMIVAITKRIRDHHGSLRIACAGERVLKVFRTCGLRAVYEFYDSPEEATLRAARGRPQLGERRDR